MDGKTDQCSKGIDINFNHIGFSVYGQVTTQPLCLCLLTCIVHVHILCQVRSSGSESGPRGVTVTIINSAGIIPLTV